MELRTLAETLDAGRTDIESALDRLRQSLSGRGLALLRDGEAVQLTTSPAASDDVRRYLRSEEASTLSAAALETLAIIAYRQPVTRAGIEAIRGVGSESPLRTLLRLGLVTEIERLDQPGRPITYGTTSGFLRLLGLSSLEELPPLPD